jgi:ABC-2 type transport system ATP-binding protein
LSESLITLNNITKKYNDKTELKNVSLTLERGKIYGLIGKNGAGKTTLIRIMANLTFPDTGEVTVTENLRSSYIVETPAFFPNETAFDNMKSRAILHDKPLSQIQPLLELVGLPDTGKKRARDFSLGMKQRLGIALALLSEPEFLVLDEPTNGLDPEGAADIRNLIKKFRAETGAAVLLSSHQLAELSQIADEFIFIHEGRLIEQITRTVLEKRVRKAITLSVSDPDAAQRILRIKLGITDSDVEDGFLIIRDDPPDTSVIPQILIENAVRIYHLIPSHATLEDYFLALIHEKGG